MTTNIFTFWVKDMSTSKEDKYLIIDGVAHKVDNSLYYKIIEGSPSWPLLKEAVAKLNIGDPIKDMYAVKDTNELYVDGTFYTLSLQDVRMGKFICIKERKPEHKNLPEAKCAKYGDTFEDVEAYRAY